MKATGSWEPGDETLAGVTIQGRLRKDSQALAAGPHDAGRRLLFFRVDASRGWQCVSAFATGKPESLPVPPYWGLSAGSGLGVSVGGVSGLGGSDLGGSGSAGFSFSRAGSIQLRRAWVSMCQPFGR